MRDPAELYEIDESVVVPPGLPLVAGLTGFADSGAAVTQLSSYLTDTLERAIRGETVEIWPSRGTNAVPAAFDPTTGESKTPTTGTPPWMCTPIASRILVRESFAASSRPKS